MAAQTTLVDTDLPEEELTPDEIAWLAMGPFDGGVPGLVRRVRRRLDVSQRGLAHRLGVSQARVARWETGATCPKVEVLRLLLEMSGLRMVVVDEEDRPVRPMRDDGARNRGGRRYPAHVDLRVVGWWMPREAMMTADCLLWTARSRARRDPAITFDLQPWMRHTRRRLLGTPVDHPALHQLAVEAEWLDQQWDARRSARSAD